MAPSRVMATWMLCRLSSPADWACGFSTSTPVCCARVELRMVKIKITNTTSIRGTTSMWKAPLRRAGMKKGFMSCPPFGKPLRGLKKIQQMRQPVFHLVFEPGDASLQPLAQKDEDDGHQQ